MEDTLNNLLKTKEAQAVISLLGEDGFNEYVIALFDKNGGNFDETVRDLNVHSLAVSRMRDIGAMPTYQMLLSAPSASQLDIPPVAYPTPAPPTYSPQYRAPVTIPSPQQQATPSNVTPSPAPQITTTQQTVRRPTVRPMRAPQQQTFSTYQTTPTATPTPVPQGGPNVATPFENGAYMTGGLGSYYGHAGEDYGYDPNSTQRDVTNPVGGDTICRGRCRVWELLRCDRGNIHIH